jgi:integrase
LCESSIRSSRRWQNWRNYTAYYVEPYIGERTLQEINGAICDALYAKLLAEGRLKARPAKRDRTKRPVHVRRVTRDGRVLPCRPYRYDDIRCYRTHAAGDAMLGQPIIAKKPSPKTAQREDTAANWLPPGLEPKTVVNTHRMLHRAWEDFVAWGWAKRNVVSDAHPPWLVRKGRKVWTVDQLRTFLQRARSDRFFALWVLEATSGMRRGELTGARRDLLDLEGGTLTTETTRIVIDGRVVESDGKTENAQRVIALDPFTLAALRAHIELLDQERAEFGPDYEDYGLLFCWEDGTPPAPGHDHSPVLQAHRGRRSSEDQPARCAAQLRDRRA